MNAVDRDRVADRLLLLRRKNEESDQKGEDYIYRGIATRSFERRFALADHIQVKGADLKDGLLAIELGYLLDVAPKFREHATCISCHHNAMPALAAAARNGLQGALLAPTDLLARQHLAARHAAEATRVCPAAPDGRYARS